MLSSRFNDDGVPTLKLSAIQENAKRTIEEKIHSGEYQFEKVPCGICGGNTFTQLSAKDRYGLFCPVVICEECGLVLTNPRMDQNSYTKFYENEYRLLYSGSDAPTEKFFKNQYLHGKRIFNFCKNSLKLEKRLRDQIVLEVGCGAGGILKYFSEQGCSVFGVDLNEKYISYGKEKYGLDLITGTITDIPSINPDLIIYSHVLEHILVPKKELAGINKMLDEQGAVYIEVPGVLNLAYYEMDFLLYLQNAHVFHFSQSSLSNLMRQCGFQQIKANEKIMSIFKKDDKASGNVPLTNPDFSVTMNYLKRTENLRKKLPRPIRQIIRSPYGFIKGVIRSL